MKKVLNKIKWVVGLASVFLLVYATNTIDRKQVRKIRESVTTMYEDRLIVKNIIYNMATLKEEKRVAFLLSDTSFYLKRRAAANDSLQKLIARFKSTNVVYHEGRNLERFLKNFEETQRLEQEAANDLTLLGNPEWREKMQIRFERLRETLDILSDIQVSEGKRELIQVNRSFRTVDLFTSIEIMFLVVIGIIIQIVILFPTKDKDKE